MQAFKEYLVAFFGSWLLYMTAGPFVIDEVCARLLPIQWTRFVARIPKRWRRRLEVAVLLFGMFWAGFLAFKQMRDAFGRAEGGGPSIRVLEVDPDGRKKIEELSTKLAVANKALEEQQAQMNPSNHALSSVRFTVVLQIVGANEPSHDIDSGMLIVLGINEKGILWGNTAEHYQDKQGERRYIIDVPFDAFQMGEKVTTLASANSIVMQFKESMLPLGTKIARGQVAMLINNQITVEFEIPAQTIEKKANNNPVIILRDVQPQLRKAIYPAEKPKRIGSNFLHSAYVQSKS